MKTVCHMTSAHNSDDVRIFQKECSSLAKAGYDTFLIACGENREENSVHVIGIGDKPTSRLKRMTKTARAVYRSAVAINADVYHFHDPELIPYGLKLKRHGKKVVFDSHEDTFNQMRDKKWLPSFVRPLVSKVYQTYAKRAFKQFDALIAVTPHIVETMHGINPNTFQITNYPLLAPLLPRRERKDGIVLCFTGGITANWSHENILIALNHVDGANYVLCGKSTEQYIRQLSSLPGWSRTKYLGKVSHSEALKVQEVANIGMALPLPSNNSGNMLGTLGNTKLFEYMMNGLPVICTDFVLWKEIIDKYNCGVSVSPTDVDAIAAAIIYLRDHSEEAREMGNNGRKAIEQEYNWSMQERELLRLYEYLFTA